MRTRWIVVCLTLLWIVATALCCFFVYLSFSVDRLADKVERMEPSVIWRWDEKEVEDGRPLHKSD